MIPPISKIDAQTGALEVKSLSSPILHNSTSSLSSLRCTSFFSSIWNFIKWILCCRKSHGNSKDLNVPEIDPSSLQRPFRDLVFTSDSTFRSARRFELTSLIFQTLGAGGPWHWYKNLKDINKWQKELQGIKGDPLEFLYFLFLNRSMTASIVEFKRQATTSTALKMVQTLSGRKNPWEEFLEKQIKSFESQAKAELLPGFCQALGLKTTDLSPLFKKKQWQQLILYVLENRGKHFQLI